MMNSEVKDIVLSYFTEMNAGRFTEAFDLMADDVDYWVAGQEWSIGGTYDKQGLKDLFLQKIAPVLDGGLRTEVTGVTAEGERVALEVKSYGKTRNGYDYHNAYHFLYIVKNGKIVAAREYLDTLHGSLLLGP